jgi:hypothetical protein
MADDPMTITVSGTKNIGPGLCMIYGTMAGPTDYDASGGAACDLSSYLTTVYGGVSLNGVDTEADAVIVPMYLNAAGTASTGFLKFMWDSDSAAAGVLEDVVDTTNLSGYTWYFRAFGSPPTR